MKTICKNASTLLFYKAENLLLTDHKKWRAIHLNLLGNTRYTPCVLTYFVNEALEQILADTDGFIYFCEDNDIIILFQDSLTSVARKLSRHFADIEMLDYKTAATSGGIFTFYDLSVQWKDFYRLAREKFLKVELAPEIGTRRFQSFSHVSGSQSDTLN